MLGRQLILALGRAVVASSVTCEVDMQTDTIEVASPTSGVFRDYIPSLCGWSINTSGLIKSASQQYDLFELWRNRTRLRVNYYDTEQRLVRSGYAIITNLRESAPNRSIPTYSISLQGCGELAKIEYGQFTMSAQDVFVSDVHIAFAYNENRFKSRDNHFFEEQQGANIFFKSLLWPSVLTRIRLSYFSGTAEYHPIVLVAKHKGAGWDDMKETIKSLDTLNFVKLYEAAHFGGMRITNTTSIELLLSPGYRYYLMSDSDMALDYIKAEQIYLPTN